MSAIVVADLFKAAGAVSSDGTTIWRSPGVTFARTGAGTYTATFPTGQGVDQTERSAYLTRRGAVTTTQWNAPSVTQTSDNTMTITWASGTTGVPGDTDFDILIVSAPRR